MNEIGKGYLEKTGLKSSEGLYKVVDFLSSPESVCKMVVVSELGLPAITAVVKELEEKYSNFEDFELNTNKKENAANRRTVGWMIKYILKQYGFFPMEVDGSRMRLRKFSCNRFFMSGAVYSKVTTGKYRITVNAEYTESEI